MFVYFVSTPVRVNMQYLVHSRATAIHLNDISIEFESLMVPKLWLPLYDETDRKYSQWPNHDTKKTQDCESEGRDVISASDRSCQKKKQNIKVAGPSHSFLLRLEGKGSTIEKGLENKRSHLDLCELTSQRQTALRRRPVLYARDSDNTSLNINLQFRGAHGFDIRDNAHWLALFFSSAAMTHKKGRIGGLPDRLTRSRRARISRTDSKLALGWF